MRICPRCRSTYAEETEFCGIDGEQLVEQDRDPLIGERIDRYEFVERLGGGAMGVVYRARHTELDRLFAIKVLYGEIGANKSLVGRFRREAQAVSKISHPNIIAVVDFGTTDNGLNFLVMESVDGKTLSDTLLEEVRFRPERAAWITAQVAAGLSEAHRLGFVHRDVKPANVMLTGPRGREQVKLLDFGIVGLTDSQFTTKLTGTGRIVGTPRYMSPEQARGAQAEPSTDLYSLGVMLYEMLAGDVPFPGDVMADVLVMHSTQPPPMLPDLGGIEHICLRMLAKRPEDRPSSAQAVIEQLRATFPELVSGASDLLSSMTPPPFDEDQIPTARPQRRDPSLEIPETASDEPSPTSGPRVIPIFDPAADLMQGVTSSQELAADLQLEGAQPAKARRESGANWQEFYGSGPDPFLKPRPTSDFDPKPLTAPIVEPQQSAIFSTLGGASEQISVPAAAKGWWSRRGTFFALINIVFSLTALGVVFLILKMDPTQSQIEQKVIDAENRARLAEDQARAAFEQAQRAERAAQKAAGTSTTTDQLPSTKTPDGVSISESEQLLQHTLRERGLTLADLEHLDSTKELIPLWIGMRDKSSPEAATVLSTLIDKTKASEVTNNLLWKKYERISTDLIQLSRDRPAVVKPLLAERRLIKAKLNKRRVNRAQRDEIAKALTKLELEVAGARIAP